MKKLFTLIMAFLVLAGTFAAGPRNIHAQAPYSPTDVTFSMDNDGLYVSSQASEWIVAAADASYETRIVLSEYETGTRGGEIVKDYNESFTITYDGKAFVIPAAQIPDTVFDGVFQLILIVEGYDNATSTNTVEFNRGYAKYVHIILHANGGAFNNQDDPQEFDMVRGHTLYDAAWDDNAIDLYPGRDNYLFTGWYDSNGNLTDIYEDEILGDMEFYAHWNTLSFAYDNGLYVYSDNEEWIEEASSYSDSYNNCGIYLWGLYSYNFSNYGAYNIIEKGDGYLFISEKNLLNYCRLEEIVFNSLSLRLGSNDSQTISFDEIQIDGVKEVPTDVSLHQDEAGNLIIRSSNRDYLQALTDPSVVDEEGRFTSIGTRISAADQYTTSSDARNRWPYSSCFIINTDDEQPIVYDAEKGEVVIAYQTLVDKYFYSDTYRFYVDASGYQGTTISIDLVMPECIVTFDPDNGEEVSTISVTKGKEAYNPSFPEKDGYSFLGWYLGEEAYDFGTPVVSDITLKAKWGHLSAVYDNGLYLYADDDAWLEAVVKESNRSHIHGIGLFGEYATDFYYNSFLYHIVEKREGCLFISKKNLNNFSNFTGRTINEINVYIGQDNYTPVPTEEFDLEGSKEAPLDVSLHQDEAGNLVIRSSDKDFLRALTDPCVLDEERRITSIGATITTRDSTTTSGDVRNRKPGDPGFIVNTADSQPIVYDAEKGEAVISYATLISNQMGADEYRISIHASGYLGTSAYIVLDLPEKCIVTFDPDNGESLSKASVYKNSPVSKPVSPVKSGYVFTGWYLNGVLYDFSTPVTSDIELVAGWVKGEIRNGENTIPEYADETKQEVAESVDDSNVDISGMIDSLMTEDVLDALESAEVQALGEDARLTVETSLSLQITDVTLDENGAIVDFIVDIVPQYCLKASNADQTETVTVKDWTALPENGESVTVKVYVPESMAAFGNLWVKHKGFVIGEEHEVLHDENGWYIEFENDQGFSPFEISVEQLYIDDFDYIRIYRESRLQESIKVADELKSVLGVEKFNAIIVAKDSDFADALSGSYLAARKKAPILLVNGSNYQEAYNYIRSSLKSTGTVYILGGSSAVSYSFEENIGSGIKVKRIEGSSRYMTNLDILTEAGMGSAKDIFVVTGSGYADSLSSASAGLPILMVDSSKTALKNSQIKWLKSQNIRYIYVLGQTASVNASLEKALKSYCTKKVVRIGGDSRWITTRLVAEKFFASPEYATLATGNDFADGLIASPLAYALKSPLLMVASNKTGQAKTYVQNHPSITKAYIVGSKDNVSDEAARKILLLEESTVILER